MMKFLTSRRFGLWWSLAAKWFNARFERLQTAISQIEIEIPEDIARKTDIPSVESIQSGLAKSSEMPIGYAKESTLGTFGEGKSVATELADISQELDKLGSPAEGQPQTIFEAIAAGGGGGASSIREVTTEEIEAIVERVIS